MPRHTHCIEAGLAAIIEDLYREIRAETKPGEIDLFALAVGPLLRRRPWLVPCFSSTMVHESDDALRGRERLYSQLRDLLDLLQLQRNPRDSLWPTRQHVTAAYLEQALGVAITPDAITWLTDHEYDEAVTRLTAFLASMDISSKAMTFIQWHVPLVVATMYDEHTYQVPRKKTLRFIPAKLDPGSLLWWFQERLVHAVTTRLERYPDNAVWILRDGSRFNARPGLQRVFDLDHHAFDALLRDICQPEGAVRIGRRPGSSRYYSRERFHARYPGAVADATKRRGEHVNDEHIARALGTSLSTFYRCIRDYGRPPLY